jgi:hypothetical protein
MKQSVNNQPANRTDNDPVYEAPSIEVIEVKIPQGFAYSQPSGPGGW